MQFSVNVVQAFHSFSFFQYKKSTRDISIFFTNVIWSYHCVLDFVVNSFLQSFLLFWIWNKNNFDGYWKVVVLCYYLYESVQYLIERILALLHLARSAPAFLNKILFRQKSFNKFQNQTNMAAKTIFMLYLEMKFKSPSKCLPLQKSIAILAFIWRSLLQSLQNTPPFFLRIQIMIEVCDEWCERNLHKNIAIHNSTITAHVT